MRATTTASRGFTLFELVLVMAIIAVCAAVVAPYLGGFARGRVLPNTATQFAATARWCRSQAISEGVTYRLNFDAENGKWWVTKGDGKIFKPVTDELGKEYVLPEGLVIETTLQPAEDGLYATFDPAGRSTTAAFKLKSGENWIEVVCDTPRSSYRILPPGQSVMQ
jgi:prepilin-type N-terminal cleavage/methylation domain-containing protein